MGFQITVNAGEAGPIIICGTSDGTVEFCRWIDRKEKDKDSGEITVVRDLQSYKYYASVEQAFFKIASMRIGSADAISLQELVAAIKQIRLDIKQEMGVL
jgi:hypothetical protein